MTQQAVEPTPRKTPWRVAETDDGFVYIGNDETCYLGPILGAKNTIANVGRKADAELIVRAVNNEAMLVEALEAHYRLDDNLYLPWTDAGGSNQCKHGYADCIPCRECDLQTIKESRKALAPYRKEAPDGN